MTVRHSFDVTTDITLFISLDYLCKLTVRASLPLDVMPKDRLKEFIPYFPIRCNIHSGSLNKCAINLVNSYGVEINLIFVGPERWSQRPINIGGRDTCESGLESARSTKGPKRRYELHTQRWVHP